MIVVLAQQFQVISRAFEWRICLDALLIGIGLFYLYQTLQRLGTWKIGVGVLIAIGVFIVAQLLQLQGISWIYSNLSGVALMALIVIFQPELRKIFERAASLSRRQVGKEKTELSQLISQAVFTLTEKREGALIVLPGKESVTAWISEGITIDAKPSVPLILSLFSHDSPTHDGAMVIENGKITACGVHLPLSKRNNLPQGFGTRHHAAMGLSEVTDALVIAVSEERGAVVFFSKGTMEVAEDKNEVAARILSHREVTDSYSLLRRKAKRQWSTLLEVAVCLMLAFGRVHLMASAQSKVHEKVLTTPIEYILPSDGKTSVDETHATVKLRLAGAEFLLDRIDAEQLKVQIDMSQKEVGEHSIQLRTDQIKGLPSGVKIRDVEPKVLGLSLKKWEEKQARIKPDLVGKLRDGLTVESVSVNPQFVRVLSPATKHKENEIHLTTAPIDLQEVQQTTTRKCKIIVPPGIQPADEQWTTVEVQIVIQNQKGDHHVPENPVSKTK